jgi:acyl-CoA thioester hydrolase
VSAPHTAAPTPPPGRPKAGAAPTGGSEPRAAGSVGAPFTWPVRVYWEDTDAGGIVFYANYLKFFERARTEWLRHLGLGQQALRDEVGGMFVVSETQVQYHRPARLDDLLLVTAHVREAGRASLTIEQRALLKPLLAGDPPTLLCEGRIRIGWVDARSLRPQRIPAQVLDALQGPA